jgi:hypothetical protein
MLVRVIEEKRNEMIYVAKRFGLSSVRTVKCSQELDKLLNLLNRQLLNGKMKSKKIS